MNENNPLKLEILNHLIYLSTRFQSVFISQGTLAAKYGVSLRQINRLLSQWRSEGILRYRQQGFNRSCIYHINPILCQEKYRIKFKLPAAVLLLMVSSLCSAVFSGDVLLSNNKNIYIQNNSWMVTVPNAGYHFYEQHPSTETIVFLKNSKQSSSIHVIASKERVMEQSIAMQLAAAFNINTEQAEQYSNRYSKSILLKALQSFEIQHKKRRISSPAGWLAWVLADEEKKEQERVSQPKTGRVGDYAKKVVYGRSNNNHSPSIEHVKTDNKEREQYLLIEIAKFKKSLATIKTTPELQALGEKRIMAMEAELADLLKDSKPWHSNPVKIRDFEAEREQAKAYRSDDLSYERSLDDIVDRIKPSDPQAYKDFLRLREFRNKIGLIYK